MQASIVCLSKDKFEAFSQTVPSNLKNSGLSDSDFEFLLCDNGSSDERLFDLYKSLPTTYLRLNKYNEGVARSLNQLILRAKGKHIFFMPDDFILPDNWLAELVRYADGISTAGVIGFDGQDLVLPTVHVDGFDVAMHPDDSVYEGSQVFGATLYTRRVLATIGVFCEDYHPYGLEDSDFCFRSKMAGFKNFYIPGLVSRHIGLDHNADIESKKAAYFSNLGLHRWRFCNYARIGLYEPLPIARPAWS